MYKLMLVEDEPLIRAGLKKYFDWEALGVGVIIEAENGKKGMELSFEENPDLIITDIRMPIMDGLEMIKSIREKQPKMPFIILTGFNEFEYAQKAIQYGGVHDFLLKPLQREESYQAVVSCMESLGKNDLSSNNAAETLPIEEAEHADLTLFEQIEAYIVEHINGDVSLHTVADYFFYNASYLSRLFKSKLGINYLDFLKDIKIKTAQTYLQDNNLSIADVSRKSGFNSYKHFAKTFRTLTEMTPTEYRKHLRS